MLAEKVIVLRNIFIVEVRDAEVEQDVEEEGKVEEGDVITIHLSAHSDLHVAINAQYPERLDEQVQGEDEKKVGNELALHFLKRGANVINLWGGGNWNYSGD